jgi:hypothetical protein
MQISGQRLEKLTNHLRNYRIAGKEAIGDHLDGKNKHSSCTTPVCVIIIWA